MYSGADTGFQVIFRARNVRKLLRTTAISAVPPNFGANRWGTKGSGRVHHYDSSTYDHQAFF